MPRYTEKEIDLKSKEIQSWHSLNSSFLTQLPKLDNSSEANLKNLNDWLINNKRNHKILDILVFNIIPGVLTLGIFHLCYYVGQFIAILVKSYLLKQKVTFHTNWTDHLTTFKNSQTAVEQIELLQNDLTNNLKESNDSTETKPKETQNIEEYLGPPVFLSLIEHTYVHVFKYLQPKDLARLQITCWTGEDWVNNYYFNRFLQGPCDLPSDKKEKERALNVLLEKALKNNLDDLLIFVAKNCDAGPLKKRAFDALLEMALKNNREDLLKYVAEYSDDREQKNRALKELAEKAIENDLKNLLEYVIRLRGQDRSDIYPDVVTYKSIRNKKDELVDFILSLEDPITGNKLIDINAHIMPQMVGHIGLENFKPFTYAAECGSVEIMKICVKHGARLVSSGRRELSHALRGNNLDCVKMILEMARDKKELLNNRVYCKPPLTPLFEAIYSGCSVEIVKELIAQGANANDKLDPFNTHLIEYAIIHQRISIFRLLLTYNLSLDEKTSKFVEIIVPVLKKLNDAGMDDKNIENAKIPGGITSFLESISEGKKLDEEITILALMKDIKELSTQSTQAQP